MHKQWRISARRRRRLLTKSASTSMLVPTSTGLLYFRNPFFVFAATQAFSELKLWLGKGISLLLSTSLTVWTLSRPIRTEFEGVKILFWQLHCQFLLIFTRGLVVHCTSGHSLNPPLCIDSISRASLTKMGSL